VRRLLLSGTRRPRLPGAVAFPADEPSDERAVAEARFLSAALPQRFEVLTSTAARCRETAAAAGPEARPTVQLDACDFGTCAGRTPASVHEDPEAVPAWMTDPAASPHGGESLETFGRRVGKWVDEQAGGRHCGSCPLPER
jgi:broad specificity phosphatase PhoE